MQKSNYARVINLTSIFSTRTIEKRTSYTASKAALLMNDGIRYFYEENITGVDEFYEYAVRLNLMIGDTAKARDVHQKIHELKASRIDQ